MPLAAKVINRTKRLSLWAPTALSLKNESFPTRCERFRVVNHTSMMTRTQSRHPCRAVQLGEAVLLNIPVSPIAFAPKTSLFVLKLQMRKSSGGANN